MENNDKLPRGIRNNNPGNIKRSNDPWQGLATIQNDDKFFQFKTMAYGIRALARTLITYQDKYDIRTVEQFVARYAPASENDVDNYIGVVSREAKIHKKVKLNFHNYEDLEPIVRGILRMENGVIWKKYIRQGDIDEGLRLAGVPHNKPLAKSKTVQAATVAATGGALQVIAEAANNLAPAVSLFEQVISWFPYLGAVLIVAGLGYIIYSKFKERSRY